MEKRNPDILLVEMEIDSTPTQKTKWRIFKITKIRLPMVTSWYISKGMKIPISKRDIYTPMFITGLFTIAKNMKQAKVSTVECKENVRIHIRPK